MKHQTITKGLAIFLSVLFIGTSSRGILFGAEKPSKKTEIQEENKKCISVKDLKDLAKGKVGISYLVQKYNHKEVGSGLYILDFPINKRYSLTVGSASADGKPVYMHINDHVTSSWTYLSEVAAENLEIGLSQYGLYSIVGAWNIDGSKYAVVETVGDKRMEDNPSVVTIFDNTFLSGKIIARQSFLKASTLLWNGEGKYLAFVSKRGAITETVLYSEETGFKVLNGEKILKTISLKKPTVSSSLDCSLEAVKWIDNQTLSLKYFYPSEAGSADKDQKQSDFIEYSIADLASANTADALDMSKRAEITNKEQAVIKLKNKNTFSISESGSFKAQDNQTLYLNITSNITGGTVDLFLFSPGGEEQRITVGASSISKEIKLSQGVWAYNCTGMFQGGGNIEITGTIKN